MFLFDYYEYVVKDIQKNIYEERLKYKKMYDLCEEFLRKHSEHFLLTGTKSLKRFLGLEEDFLFEVFCQNALSWALSLSNYLAEHTEEPIIFAMSSLVPYQKFSIKGNGREIIIIQELSKESKNITVKMTNPINLSGFYLVQPIIQMIQVYQNLYNISLFDKWPDFLDLNGKIINKTFLGGAEVASGKELFLNNFAKHNPNIVLISDSAYEVLNDVQSNSVSIMTTISPSEIAEEYRKYMPGFEVVSQSILLFSDWRLRKTVFILNGKIIFNIYNSATYEIIPHFKHKHYNIANKYVLLRFVLIDLWQLSLLLNLQKIEKSYYDQRIARLKIQFRAFNEQPDLKEGFLGIYKDEKIEWKLNKKFNSCKKDYFPQIQKKITGTYKSINS